MCSCQPNLAGVNIGEPVNQDITIRRGDTFRLRFKAKAGGVPINLTGYTFLAQIRTSEDATTALASFSASIIDATAGIFEIVLSAATTAALPTDTTRLGVWDLQWTTAGGDVNTLVTGVAHLKSDVARP